MAAFPHPSVSLAEAAKLARVWGERRSIRLAAAGLAHSVALLTVLAVVLARLAAAPPDPDLVRSAVRHAEAALGGRYDVSVRDASWTLAGGRFGLALKKVRLDPTASGPGVMVQRAVASLGLGGNLRALRLDGVEPAFPPARPGPIDLSPLERTLAGNLAPALEGLARTGLERLEVRDIRSPRALGSGRKRRLDRPVAFPISLALKRSDAGYDVSADLRVRNAVVPLEGTVSRAGELLLAARATPLSKIWTSPGFGTDASLNAMLTAGPGSAVALDLSLDEAPLRLGSQTATLDAMSARVLLHDGALRIVRVALDAGRNRLSGTGTAAVHRADDGAPIASFALDLADTTLAPADIAADPLSVAATVSGVIDFRAREIELADLAVSGDGLAVAGSARFGLRGPTPAVRLDLRADDAPAAALASLWPSWIASAARGWLAANVTEGQLHDGSLAIDIAAGRLASLAAEPLRPDELRASGTVRNGTTALFGDLPPLTDAEATLRYAGTRLSVDLATGLTGSLAGPVPLSRSTFALLDTSDPALPARFDIALSGQAAALGALADAQPIGALAAAGFAPDELDGTASGRLSGTVMLREPERRDWALDLNLDRVALLRALEGRTIGDLTGSLKADPFGVTLDADGLLDGIRARFDVIEPIAFPVPDLERRRRVEMTLDRAALRDLSPGLADLVDGPVAVEAQVAEDGAEIRIDLEGAAVTLPWLGWSKGKGIAATATLVAREDGEQTRIDDLVIEGRGFGARGSALIDGDGMERLTLERAALSAGDSIAVDVTRNGDRWIVDATGESFDARGLLTALDPRDGTDDGDSEPVTVTARIATVRGHGGVEANGVRVRYAADRNGMKLVDLRGRIGARQVVVDGSRRGDGSDVFATTDDLGAVLRFLDLYDRVRGGVLTASFGKRGGTAWSGEVAASDVEILDEPKLRVMASKVSRRGRIDGSRVRIARGSVDVTYHDGAIGLENGIVRGPEVGAAFAGTLVDAAGRIALTGTFLPAYGLNRIFGEVPILGAVLGNGRDKGLVGLTFRLSGETKRPKIEVNPLSALAPGMFRRIFEYR